MISYIVQNTIYLKVKIKKIYWWYYEFMGGSYVVDPLPDSFFNIWKTNLYINIKVCTLKIRHSLPDNRKLAYEHGLCRTAICYRMKYLSPPHNMHLPVHPAKPTIALSTTLRCCFISTPCHSHFCYYLLPATCYPSSSSAILQRSQFPSPFEILSHSSSKSWFLTPDTHTPCGLL